MGQPGHSFPAGSADLRGQLVARLGLGTLGWQVAGRVAPGSQQRRPCPLHVAPHPPGGQASGSHSAHFPSLCEASAMAKFRISPGEGVWGLLKGMDAGRPARGPLLRQPTLEPQEGGNHWDSLTKTNS